MPVPHGEFPHNEFVPVIEKTWPYWSTFGLKPLAPREQAG